MFCKVNSAVLCGIDSVVVNVEADVCDGMPVFDMVGDLSSQVREARERVRTGIKNSGYLLNARHIVVNISPADLRKEGTLLDLPIAIAVLAGFGYVDLLSMTDYLIFGELSLDGSINPVNGVISIVIAAKEAGYKRCILPRENAGEGSVIEGIDIIGVNNLREVVEYLNNRKTIMPEWTAPNSTGCNNEDLDNNVDFSDINGQESTKRACEIAAAGLHNILMIGPQGSGKTMIAKRIPTIMPKLNTNEMIEISKIHSVAGALIDKKLIKTRPFRAPHHTITSTSLVGGGSRGKLGEITLAHKGILFLDELPEFNKKALEVLRQPIEERCVNISRLYGKYTYPADFMLVAAMNPCKCGYYPDMHKCTCSMGDINRYLGRISGPLLDRIDLCTEVPRVIYKDILTTSNNEKSEIIKKRVENAHEIQMNRYENTNFSYNSDLDINGIKKFCKLSDMENKFMEKVFEKMNLSVRGYHRILKTARTIADLNSDENISIDHLREAICYRMVDKKYWGRQ